MSAPVLTVANQLTILRMGLAPLLVVLVLHRRLGWALAVFAVAGLTDMLDGLIARRSRQQTVLGAMLDPVADKILLTSTFVALTWGPDLAVAIPAWLTVTTLSRDAIIILSVAVINLTVGRRVYYPSILGKLSTGTQLLTVALVLLANAAGMELPFLRVVFVIALALTIASGVHYTYLASSGRGGVAVP